MSASRGIPQGGDASPVTFTERVCEAGMTAATYDTLMIVFTVLG